MEYIIKQDKAIGDGEKKNTDIIQPVRIAQVIGKMWAGGVEAVVFNYYRAINHHLIQYDFFYDSDSTVEPPQELIDMGARFYKLPPYQKIWRYIPKLKRYLRKENYKVVHSHLNTLSVFPLFVAWLVGIPTRIAHNHSVPAGNEFRRNIAKNVLKLFSRVFATDYFACSEKAGRWLFGNKTYEKGQINVINNAIEFSKFKISEEETKQVKNNLNFDNCFVIGHVGRFTFAKNHMKLLEIFKEIYMDNSDARLLLVGDGELHDQIMDKIAELKLENVVVCTGKVSDPQRYYSVMDVLILPSTYEGVPLTVIEAQIAGIPIIVSDVVPRSACISTGCVFKSIADSNSEWAKEAMMMKKKECVLLENAKAYSIEECVNKLQGFYLEKCKEVK